MDKIPSLVSRGLFAVASALAVLAVWEKLANLMGRTLAFLGGYGPTRLLDAAVVALLFVIALQLREIKGPTAGRHGSGQ
jgi:hypothetical protein